MKLQIPKRIRVEDFKSDDQDLISKIAYIYNDFANSVYQVLNKQIDYDNLNRQLVSITVNMDSTGKVQNPPQIKFGLSGKVRGIVVIAATNQNNNTVFPTATPFISWTINSTNVLTIQNISGLQSGTSYALTLEVIGSSN